MTTRPKLRQPAAARVNLSIEQAGVTRVASEAVVLAAFQNVDPAGATLAMDAALGGIISDLASHRALTAAAGEIFMLPVPPGRVRSRHVVLAGLGDFATHSPSARRLAAANAVRTLALCGIRDCAFVLWGTASGVPATESAASLVAGFADALQELAPAQRPRRLRIISRSPRRLSAARRAIERRLPGLPGGDLLALAPAPTRRPPARPTPAAAAATACSYLFVRETGGELAASLLGPGDKGTALHALRRLDRRALDAVLGGLGNENSARQLARLGAKLADLLLPAPIFEGLAALRQAPLVVVHDAAASRWPWEAMCIDGHAPATGRGLCRRYAAEDMAVARWLERRRSAQSLCVLLVINPTEDLPGAEREGKAVRTALARVPGVEITELAGGEATRSRVLAEFRSGAYDVVHYAGHAFFEPSAPARSGILCAGGRVLPGADLVDLPALPALMFFNACESGRIRGRSGRRAALERGTGMAEAFLRAGLANYLGTWWPVGDAAALEFARTAYGQLAAGSTLGAAVLAGRNAVLKQGSGDWANYLHYGGHDFRLKC